MKRRFRTSSRCETGKTRYPNEVEAAKALKRFATNRALRGDARAERRFYRCRHCRGFHLTSAPHRKDR